MIKINNSLIKELAIKKGEATNSEKIRNRKEKGQTEKSDLQNETLRNIEISKEAELIDKASKLMAEFETVNYEKVKELKIMLENGEYTPDDKAIAGKIAEILINGGVA